MRKMVKPYLHLFLTYIALEAFRHTGWMLFYEQLVESTRQEINIGFILYSGMIFIAAMSVPFLLGRWKITDGKRLRSIFIAAVCCALIFRLLQLITGITGAYIFLVLWTLAIMTAISICYIHIFRLVPRAVLGRFFGTAYLADAIIIILVELFTGTVTYYWVSVIVGVILCIAAVILYNRLASSCGTDVVEDHGKKPPVRFVRLAVLALVIYVLIAGTLDNLYFFDEWISLPALYAYDLPMMGVMYLVSGFLFDKAKPKYIIPLAFVAICAAQSMTFFITGSAFSFSYSALSYLGSTLLEIVTVVTPICYARMSKRGFRISAFGEGLFYGGFALSSIWFLFMTQSAYRYVMGGVLLAAIVCLLLLTVLIVYHERDRHRREMEIQGQEMDTLRLKVSIANAVTSTESPLDEEPANVYFTKREKELMPLIVSTLTAEEIAEQAHISPSTVRFHIKNILGKTGAKNRRELARILGKSK